MKQRSMLHIDDLYLLGVTRNVQEVMAILFCFSVYLECFSFVGFALTRLENEGVVLVS